MRWRRAGLVFGFVFAFGIVGALVRALVDGPDLMLPAFIGVGAGLGFAVAERIERSRARSVDRLG